VVAAVAGLGALALLPACSEGESTLDADELERDIRSNLQRSNRVSSVDCPDGVKLEKGVTFTCTARVEGKRRIVDVLLETPEKVTFGLRTSS
jgi:hypothetical protein